MMKDSTKNQSATVVADLSLEKKRLICGHIRSMKSAGRRDRHDVDDWLRAEAGLTGRAVETDA